MDEQNRLTEEQVKQIHGGGWFDNLWKKVKTTENDTPNITNNKSTPVGTLPTSTPVD